MTKTFDEWFEENSFDLSGFVYYDMRYFSNLSFKLALKDAWEASRRNMTTKDI